MVSLLNPGIGVDYCRRRGGQLSPITVGRRLHAPASLPFLSISTNAMVNSVTMA
jgi:hypothetical protein